MDRRQALWYITSAQIALERAKVIIELEHFDYDPSYYLDDAKFHAEQAKNKLKEQ